MSDQPTEQSVTKSIVVRLNIERAFRIWTEQIKAWWPLSHSISGDPRTQVFIEGKVGGRFYERASDGVEYDWGAVTTWEPPYRLVHTWYLGSNQQLPTRVEVQFVALNENETRIEVEHRGPELIGDLWSQRQRIFAGAWETVLAKFAAFPTASLDAD